MNKKLLTSVLALVAIIVLAWYAFFSESANQKNDLSNEDQKQDESVSFMPPPGSGAGFAKMASNSVYIAEQRPGNEIIANIVNMDKPGYIVIHEVHDGQAGAIIGSSTLLSETSEKNIPVTLIRSVIDGEELMAMLHTEMGGAGFDAGIDQPVLDTQGAVLYMVFSVSADAADPEDIEVMF